MQSPLFIEISTYQKSNYNKPFCSHIKWLQPYIRAFQYQVLNSIFYTNEKLYKIGFILHKDVTFRNSESET